MSTIRQLEANTYTPCRNLSSIYKLPLSVIYRVQPSLCLCQPKEWWLFTRIAKKHNIRVCTEGNSTSQGICYWLNSWSYQRYYTHTTYSWHYRSKTIRCFWSGTGAHVLLTDHTACSSCCSCLVSFHKRKAADRHWNTAVGGSAYDLSQATASLL